MRFYTVLATRPVYYDRNPLVVDSVYYATPGPAGDTTRWTYTVPSARKCFVEHIMLGTVRVSAAGAAGQVTAYLNYAPSGGGGGINSATWVYTNVLGDRDRVDTASFGMVAAGDVLTGHTIDTSTGGTNTFNVSLKGTEFDA